MRNAKKPLQHRRGGARPIRNRGLIPLFLCLLLVVADGQAQTVLKSGPERVALLELYTSQGCSSCPPADRWLSGLKDQPGLWTRVVPVAFHVDYWDYIGWRDPFARAEYGQRQGRYARDGGVRTVYTPGVMLNGADWRDWRHTAFPQPSRTLAGTLTLERGGSGLSVRFTPGGTLQDDLRVSVALLGFDLESKVTRGENRGRNLKGDFIALELQDGPLERAAGGYTARLPAFPAHPEAPRLAMAAWVTKASNQSPLQAVGGWLPEHSHPSPK